MDDLPGQLLEAWDTGPWLNVEEIFGGAVNRVYAVDTATDRFVLRRYGTVSPSLLAREALVTRAVSDRGLPAIAPIRTRAGGDAVEAQGAHFALFPFATGAQRDADTLTSAEIDSAGATLGRMHRALAELPTDDRRAPRLAWDGDAWVARLEKVETAILARPGLSPADEIALARVRDQRAWLADPACRHAEDLTGPLQVIHGDYHHRNLFFADQQVSAIIDWEQTGLMPRAFEAVRAATYMFELRPAPTEAFLGAWMTSTGASPAELDRGAEMFAVLRDHWVWAVEEVYMSGNAAAAAFIPATPFEPFLRTWSRLKLAP